MLLLGVGIAAAENVAENADAQSHSSKADVQQAADCPAAAAIVGAAAVLSSGSVAPSIHPLPLSQLRLFPVPLRLLPASKRRRDSPPKHFRVLSVRVVVVAAAAAASAAAAAAAAAALLLVEESSRERDSVLVESVRLLSLLVLPLREPLEAPSVVVVVQRAAAMAAGTEGHRRVTGTQGWADAAAAAAGGVWCLVKVVQACEMLVVPTTSTL